MRIMKLFGVLTIITLVALILFLRRKGRQKEAEWAAHGVDVGNFRKV
jgi:hypothetical protein